MKYESTRNKNTKVLSHQAVIRGLADDGGLFVPEKIDIHFDLEKLCSLSYQEAACEIIHAFLDDYSEEEIRKCVDNAYDDKFSSNEIVPLHLIENGAFMELWHGPTCAFKDVALTILPHLLTAAYKKENRDDTVAILTATSGDTGKAALSGFADVPHTNITVFYPEIGVSPIQKKQMNTSEGKNVEVIAVKGNFDDCQRLVKQSVHDPLVEKNLKGVTISSANSINIGRLVPQIVYYYTAYASLVRKGKIRCGEEINYTVPTGNFGDILAGWLAKETGLPVHKLICASNTNNVLTDFINTGIYDRRRTFHPTISPSMDILISSNLERLLYLLSARNDSLVAELMKELNEKGVYTVPAEIKEKIQKDFSAYWTDEDACRKTIKAAFEEDHALIDPHTAVALHAMRQYQKETGDTRMNVVLSTASPYKFAANVVQSLTGTKPEDDFDAMDQLYQLTGEPIPYSLSTLKDKPVRFTRVIEIKDGIQTIADKMKELGNDHD